MLNHTIRCYGLDVTPEMRTFWGREATVMGIDIIGKKPMYGLSIDSESIGGALKCWNWMSMRLFCMNQILNLKSLTLYFNQKLSNMQGFHNFAP